jgi:multicopper oxidase
MRDRMDRRQFVRTGGGIAAALIAAPLTACDRALIGRGQDDLPLSSRRIPSGPARDIDIVAEPAAVEIGPLGVFRRWTYGGWYPGPEIRLREGERLRARLVNRLPDPTTVHWHGVPVPNEADGVPGVTQEAVRPGEEFLYDFNASPAGSYIYHSHVGLQLDRGLHAPLIVEEATPHVEHDREHTVVIDDLLAGEPEMPDPDVRRGPGMMGRRGMMAMMQDETPDYLAFLINGRPPEDPPVLDVTEGERVRLRLMNPASATHFRVALGGHRMSVTHTDGRPVEPVEVDALEIGMGERYDVLVEARNPGIWTLAADGLGGNPPPARAIVRYRGVNRSAPAGLPEGLRSGRLLRLADLQSVETDPESARDPDRVLDLDLRREMMMRGRWTIDGQAWPDADPLPMSAGERVRVRMTNRSPHPHPMHLHGFFFRVADALKETVVVPGHMGRIAFDFTANEPGDWFFHCHHLYHMESGMARVFSYI